jgi:hypothetical protein
MKSPENVVFAAVQLLPADEREILKHRWGLEGHEPAENVDTAAARIGVPRLLARRSYARGVARLRSSDLTRRAFDQFQARRVA